MLERIEGDISISKDPNPALKGLWQALAIEFDYKYVFDYAHEFLTTCGRTAYISPVYDSLIKNGYRYLAYEWY